MDFQLKKKNVKVDGYSVADHLTTPKATSLLYKCPLSNILDDTVDSMASGSRTKWKKHFIRRDKSNLSYE